METTFTVTIRHDDAMDVQELQSELSAVLDEMPASFDNGSAVYSVSLSRKLG